jgi:hypothetical protein
LICPAWETCWWQSYRPHSSQGNWNSQAPPPRQGVDTIGGVYVYIWKHIWKLK